MMDSSAWIRGGKFFFFPDSARMFARGLQDFSGACVQMELFSQAD